MRRACLLWQPMSQTKFRRVLPGRGVCHQANATLARQRCQAEVGRCVLRATPIRSSPDSRPDVPADDSPDNLLNCLADRPPDYPPNCPPDDSPDCLRDCRRDGSPDRGQDRPPDSPGDCLPHGIPDSPPNGAPDCRPHGPEESLPNRLPDDLPGSSPNRLGDEVGYFGECRITS